MSEFIPEDLFVGDPQLVVRWRLQNNALPLKNRHLRAFGATGVSIALQSWARQHLEWTLAEGTLGQPNGVLTLSVDDQGRAVMAVEPYEPLAPAPAAELIGRAGSKRGAAVPDEVAWVCRRGRLYALADPDKPLSGVNSLVADLAKTTGDGPEFVAALEVEDADEVFLASDEHGIVASSDHAGPTCERFKGYYGKLVASTRADAYDRANLGLA